MDDNYFDATPPSPHYTAMPFKMIHVTPVSDKSYTQQTYLSTDAELPDWVNASFYSYSNWGNQQSPDISLTTTLRKRSDHP